MTMDSFVPKTAGVAAPRVDRVGGAGGARPSGATQRSGDAISFQALLDGLSARASELESGARSVERPAELSGAVERSRDAATDAAQLAEGLLEAWRQARQMETDANSSAPSRAQRS